MVLTSPHYFIRMLKHVVSILDDKTNALRTDTIMAKANALLDALESEYKR